MAPNPLMDEDARIRLENLKSLKHSATHLSQTVGNRYTYWRDLLTGNKAFGEKIARKIEDGLDLPRGWLDQVHDKDEAGPPPQLTPFAMRIASRLDAIPDHAGWINAYQRLNALLDELGAPPLVEGP